MTNDLPAMAPPDPSTDARSLRRRLRWESRASHETLDARFDGMADAPLPDVYARFLRVNEACHRVLEPILAAAPIDRIAPDFVLRRRAPSLSVDLRAMALEPLDPPAFPIARPDTAQTVGIVYVVEGSRLGAGYILSRLRGRELGAGWSAASFAYLEDGDEPHALRSFLAQASLILDGDHAIGRAVLAAQATFRYFAEVERLARGGDRS